MGLGKIDESILDPHGFLDIIQLGKEMGVHKDEIEYYDRHQVDEDISLLPFVIKDFPNRFGDKRTDLLQPYSPFYTITYNIRGTATTPPSKRVFYHESYKEGERLIGTIDIQDNEVTSAILNLTDESLTDKFLFERFREYVSHLYMICVKTETHIISLIRELGENRSDLSFLYQPGKFIFESDIYEGYFTEGFITKRIFI